MTAFLSALALKQRPPYSSVRLRLYLNTHPHHGTRLLSDTPALSPPPRLHASCFHEDATSSRKPTLREQTRGQGFIQQGAANRSSIEGKPLRMQLQHKKEIKPIYIQKITNEYWRRSTRGVLCSFNSNCEREEDIKDID